MKPKDIFFVMVLVGILSLVANLVGYKNGIMESIPGMVILIGISMLGVLIRQVIPIKIPSVAYIVLIGTLITYPGFPGSAVISGYISKVNFLALTTPILAYAGIAIGKDLDALKKTGWKIVLVACIVFIGTYIGSAVIAQSILKFMGLI
ncbi:MAG: hypothetical protein PWQ67_2024 [Clostridia bacterium]|nr:hypothetical protein [Clostridia bacterium]MDN5323570.1 hypothetical protein [Clostridia bacterium]